MTTQADEIFIYYTKEISIPSYNIDTNVQQQILCNSKENYSLSKRNIIEFRSLLFVIKTLLYFFTERMQLCLAIEQLSFASGSVFFLHNIENNVML